MSSARVVRIIDVKPLADRLDIVHVAGWRDRQSITQRGQFQPGDLGIMITPGAVVPVSEPFAWLWKGDHTISLQSFKANQRRRTIGVRRYQGQPSHALVMHPSELGFVTSPEEQGVVVSEDMDVSDTCIVEPYEDDDFIFSLGWAEPKCHRQHMPKTLKAWFKFFYYRWHAA